MKTMLLLLAASLIASVGQSRVDLDSNDVGIDDETGRVLIFLAAELQNLAAGRPSALDPSKLKQNGIIFEEPTETEPPKPRGH